MRKYFSILATATLAFLAASCAAPKEEAPAQPQPNYKLVATIKDIMDSEIDPSADYIWESISTEISAAGTVIKEPKNDEEWKEERRRAITLVEAANLLMMPGRHVARAGEKADDPKVELGPEAIEELINNDRASWLKFAEQFRNTAEEQLKVAEAKDVPGMLRLGSELDQACESCHKTYWYPAQHAQAQPAPEGK